MSDELKFADYRDRINIQDVLIDAGYKFNRRDGLRYPSYVRLDSEGKRIRGDKFIVTPGGKSCFQPPVMKTYSVTSFIWEHPELFPESAQGYRGSDLVNMVCCRLLNEPVEIRKAQIVEPERERKPFDISQYQITEFVSGKDGNFRQFFPYFAPRGIDLTTQRAFKNSFVIASMQGSNGKTYSQLSFPMRIPGREGIVGLEQRGLKRKNGTSYKGMAAGSNASEGLWMASPYNTSIKDSRLVLVFESAYDAMAFYQILTSRSSQLDDKDRKQLRYAVYVSTGGTPSYGQIEGLIRNAPNAEFHLGFDNDMAGRQFEVNFRDIASKFEDRQIKIIREEPLEGYKDFNDQLLGEIRGKEQNEGEANLATEETEKGEETHKIHHGFRR